MNDRKKQLAAEAICRRQELDDKKRQLTGATQRYKHTRHTNDGATVARLAGELRLAEIALDGVDEEIQRLSERKVEVTSPRPDLLRQRAGIVQRREWRRSQHQLQVDQERQRCGSNVEQHVQTHLGNVFGPGERARRLADEQDQRELDHISAQLTELNRREAATGNVRLLPAKSSQSEPLGAA